MAKRKPRKPKFLENKDREYVGYAAIFRDRDDIDHVAYVGGEAYGQTAQIHLTMRQAKRLAAWLNKAVAYLEAT